MEKTIQLLTIISMLVISSMPIYAQSIPTDSLYWGQTPPGDSAVVFAPGIISLSNRRETKIVFSQDGFECLIGVGVNNTFNILYSNHYSGNWLEPVPASFITNNLPIEPFFAPDSLHIFFISYADIYMCTKVNQAWSDPVKLNPPVNTSYEEYHPTITSGGTLYFCSMRENSSLDIYRARDENGNYNFVEKLPEVVNRHNSQQNGAWDPYIAPDESYIIFTSIRSGGYGQEDQYISYYRNGIWTNPKNVGSKINTNAIEYGSYISPDNKYYFFSRPSGWGPNAPADIYWVSANFIDSLKYTNFTPYLNYQIPDQSIQTGLLFNYTVPDTTFIDDDGNNTLTYSATLSNGNPLPVWLSFDPTTRTFEGIPTEAININVKVTATDNANASVSCNFAIIVIVTGIDENREQTPESMELYQNYPNPFNPTTTIEFATPRNEYVSLRIYDILGKEVKEVFSGNLNAGNHSFEFDANNISSGIYFYVLKTSTFFEQKKMIMLK